MSQRFQIEEILIQDRSGVVFRAMDTATGAPVAVRRFFPFGAHGGGLEGEERTAYDIAVARLSGLRHPALRAVVSGGSDPIDGMPYVATEWIDGMLLSERLGQGPLPPEQVRELLTRVLEICSVLSQVLAEEAVWVETDPTTIIMGTEDQRRGGTFWISPLRWLGGEDAHHHLKPILDLAEEVLGWRGMQVLPPDADGLGSWIAWLRKHHLTSSLREAREQLASSTGQCTPQPTARLLESARRRAAVRTSRPRQRAALLAAAILLPFGIGLSLYWSQPARPGAGAATPSQPPPSPGSQTNPSLPEKEVYSYHDHEALLAQKNRVVTLEGTLATTRFSNSGKTFYFEFSHQAPHEEPRGYLPTSEMTGAMSLTELQKLIGKKVRLRGVVNTQVIHHQRQWRVRPQVLVENRASIQIVEDPEHE